ncbi:hypothetical protein E2C01_059742 [Portunus trituberculatus]|uniref:Uncharacterized protein n=1 Tax=Portunus trituberculatus TaxID=210409 RepID=A0A5B7HA43_PORTR|nr:hypothetical protein [Portunus trituberculatus]
MKNYRQNAGECYSDYHSTTIGKGVEGEAREPLFTTICVDIRLPRTFSNELFSQTFANNSTLDDSRVVPPSPPSSDYFMPSDEILRNGVFLAFAGLNPRNAYGPDGVPPIVLKNYFRACSLLGQTLSPMPVDFYLYFMLEVCLY